MPSPGLDLEYHVLLRDLPEAPSDSTLLEAPELDLAEDQRSNGVDDAEDDKYPHNSTPSRMGEALQEPPLGRQLPSPVHIQPLRRWSAVELRPTYAPNHQLLLLLQLLAPVHPRQRQRQRRLPSQLEKETLYHQQLQQLSVLRLYHSASPGEFGMRGRPGITLRDR